MRKKNLLRPLRIYALAFISVFSSYFKGHAQSDIRSVESLIKRIIPAHASKFKVEILSDHFKNDEFEIETVKPSIVLRGNNGVSIASALYYYLKTYTHCQVTWNGTNLNAGETLPDVPQKIRRSSPYKYRYYLNYCTFNYSMSWWDWSRWEKEIDWMALHGINMPLAITGQEYTWHKVYTGLGFTDDELKSFFSGPAYFAWFWMGNLDGWGGPLPKHWMESHRELQKKILERERSLGMKPVLPAFTGHVPAAFNRVFPASTLKKTNWGNGFSDTYILDAEDTLFAMIGAKFIAEQTKEYGTDHLYSADTFNENEPPSDDPVFLAALSNRVYESMRRADADATWVMQGWLFYSDRKFWGSPQIRALLEAVPDDHMILLDLAAEIEPVWKRTQAFYNKPWIWNMLHNFGGNISMFGRLDSVAINPPRALHDSASGKMMGIGLTMEGIEQNPVLYELMTDHTWNDKVIDLDAWLNEYIRQRYGNVNDHAISAWKILRATVYNGKALRDGAESIICARPTFEPGRRWVKTTLNYPPAALLPAWDEMVKAIPACKGFEGFRYDIVDVTRQVLVNYALSLHQDIVVAYQKKNNIEYTEKAAQFIQLIEDVDKLLAAHPDFLLGRWLEAAKRCGETMEEKNLYERNARNLITLWGDENNRLHEYSCRQWGGLLNDFYKPRWELFFAEAGKTMQQGLLDTAMMDEVLRKWEWKWVNSHTSFSEKPVGNVITIVQQFHVKYRSHLEAVYVKRP